MHPSRLALLELPFLLGYCLLSWLITPPVCAACLSALAVLLWSEPMVRHIWRHRVSMADPPPLQPNRGRRRRAYRRWLAQRGTAGLSQARTRTRTRTKPKP